MKNKLLLIAATIMLLFSQADVVSAIKRISVDEAVQLVQSMQEGETTAETYRVYGYIVHVYAISGTYQHFMLAEEVGIKGNFQAFVKSNNSFDEGDLIAVTGNIQKIVGQSGTSVAQMKTDIAERNPQHSVWINSEHGSVDGSGIYDEGENAKLRVTPYKGYEFTKWSDGNRENPRYVRVVQDTTFTAEYYKLPSYKVSTYCENGQVYGGGEYLYNEQATLEAYPNSGYSFKQWSDGNSDNPRSIIVTRDTLFIAQCIQNQYKIEVSSSDETKGTVSGGGLYHYGDEVVLTATPIGNNQFYRWQDNNTSNPRTIKVNGSAFYYAYFGIKQCNLSVVASDIMGGSVQGGGTFDYGTQVEISAKPNSGYQFLKWSNGAKYNPYTFTIVEDMDLIAFFQKTEAEVVDATNVNVTPQDNSVTVVWPAIDGVATYELVVKDKTGAVVCTLVFNAQGQLTQIVFSSPGRDHAPQQTQSTGFSFTVTGLDEGTSYDLTLSAKSSDGKVLDQQVKSFTTTGTMTTINGTETEPQPRTAKFIDNGQLFIISNDKVYNAVGTRVK